MARTRLVPWTAALLSIGIGIGAGAGIGVGVAAPEDASRPPAGDFAVVGASLETASDRGRIEDGVLVVRAGKIAAVGTRGETPVPEGVPVVDGRGRTLMPGIVDPHSHMGVYPWPAVESNEDGNAATDPIRPEV